MTSMTHRVPVRPARTLASSSMAEPNWAFCRCRNSITFCNGQRWRPRFSFVAKRMRLCASSQRW